MIPHNFLHKIVIISDNGIVRQRYKSAFGNEGQYAVPITSRSRSWSGTKGIIDTPFLIHFKGIHSTK